jgi:hypothetical protein
MATTLRDSLCMRTTHSDEGKKASGADTDEQARPWAARHIFALSFAAVLVIVAALALFSWAMSLQLDISILSVEFAGSSERFDELLMNGDLEIQQVTNAIWLDFGFVLAYVFGLIVICMIGSRLLWSGSLGRLAGLATVAVVVAAGFDVVENAALLVGMSQQPGQDLPFQIAAAFALVKFVTLMLPLGISVAVFLSLFSRFICWTCRKPSLQSEDSGKAEDVATSDHRAWAENYVLPRGHVREINSDEPRIGVCLSGGGIRSGVFAMGAMQSLAAPDMDEKGQHHGGLDRVSFLATVSGGGYFGGALQMLRYRGRYAESDSESDFEQPGPRIPLGDAFAEGSPEVDHVRRHGKYVAEGPGQWLHALVTVLRSVLFGLVLIYGTLVIGAWIMASGYASARAFTDQLFPTIVNEVPHYCGFLSPESASLVPECSLAQPSFDSGMWIALLLPLILAGISWLTAGVGPVRWRQGVYRFAAGFLSLAGVVAVVVLVFPFLVWGLASLTESNDEAGRLGGVGAITALATVATMVWNMLGKQPGADAAVDVGKFKAGLAKAAFAVRFLTTVAVLIALIALGAVVFGAELSQALNSRFADTWSGVVSAAVAAGIILLLLALFDQTRMSLHPFYKKRLATAFAIMRSSDGAEQIDYNEVTSLSEYGKPLNAAGEQDEDGMRLIICAAAHTSGQRLGVPGRRVVPFVLSSDAIGSPRLGYLNTSQLENATAKTSYNTDMTQTAAVALSGAAFASAMGNHAGPFDKVLALTNARLGAWLPNPRYHRKRSGGDLAPLEFTRTAFPRRRRLPYFAKEIVGSYSPDDRFVYVTDGGHYENLGLVELLRRRCTLIYCVDASGDSSLAYALAQAAGLAYEELGVTISVDGEELAVNSATSGEEPNEDLRKLHERMATKSVVKGTFTYPAAAPGNPGPGTLIVGKSRLSVPPGQDATVATAGATASAAARGAGTAASAATTPASGTVAPGATNPDSARVNFPLMAYAAAHPEFPNDSTADQWFEAGQFQAYLTLGRIVGKEMASLGPASS